MNIDTPESGPFFSYVIEAARQRTLYEYQIVVEQILVAGLDLSSFSGW
jgi:hypothetical protein